jgi:hypothetical protein
MEGVSGTYFPYIDRRNGATLGTNMHFDIKALTYSSVVDCFL